MIVPLSEDGGQEFVTAMTQAAARGSSASLPRIKLLRSASLASWTPKQ